ncbi:uncharacterized protein A4U43_C03F5570 [Asparagus officinalis]|uniref:noroxomaritidine synthase n=1 Tax=Asparagus officinalis TaxID=4686 RepID=A0A5P1F8B5_ASPOF|nr:alkane hydroxylase MAH1-like [Asparagus officinalis]ONK74374.1 uncharacterized protein A4U43_C03F5570 [Asparagus officinalis]
MKPSLPTILQQAYLFFRSHPIILSILITLSLLLLYSTTRRGGKVVINWPIFGMFPSLITNNHRLLDFSADLLRESDYTFSFKGPWLLGMDFILTCDPNNANHMFNLHFSNYPKGQEFSEIFDILGNGIFNVNGDSWTDQRKMAHAFMSTRRFRSHVGESTKVKVTRVVLPLLNHIAEIDKVVDLSDVFMRFTFDTTCALVLGVDPGCLSFEFPSIPFAKALEHIEEVLLYRHTVPMAWWKLLRRLNLGEEKKMAEAIMVVDEFIGQCIRERRESAQKIDNEEEFTDLLASYIGHSDDKFLRDTLLTFLGAGKDTTGAALVWLFWLVANSPDVERKILEELVSLRPRDTSMNGDMTVFDAEETDTLVYLHAVLCETLRLYPSVPFNHKEALDSDLLPCGHKVRPRTKIIFHMYAMGRMKGIWGKDCLEFRPERWITEKGTLKHEPSYKFIAFHSGPRSCLGKSTAFTQIKSMVAAIMYNFRVQVVDGHVVEPKISIVIQAKNGLMVKLKKREVKERY